MSYIYDILWVVFGLLVCVLIKIDLDLLRETFPSSHYARKHVMVLILYYIKQL